ncbi:MAG TPA: glycosyltransferase family 1 protein [Candidatus Woesebacteria bacterium]|nr:glycosyltransferase family 1 protein [Candidatus Woesebacteria bacterium]
MIIGIDASSIPYGTGVSNYTLNLIKHLVKNDKQNHYKILFYSFRQPIHKDIENLKIQKNVSIYHYRIPPTVFDYLWNTLHVFPIEFLIGKCDIFHTWDWNHPPALKAKTITTIHDFVPFLFPETQHPRTIKNFKQKMHWAFKECHHFICVSNNTKNDLFRIFPTLNPRKVSVVSESADDRYHQFIKLPLSEKQEKINQIKKIYDLDKFFLAKGTREPRKNLQKLIDAFIKYKKVYPKSRFELAIAGKYGWGSDINHLKHPYIKVLGYIPDKDIVALNAAASCLCFPSLYEGFGLPPLEAITIGVPVISSNVSSMPEVLEEAALYINPTSTKEITNALIKITKNPTFRQNLIKKGFTQSKKFSWDKTAKNTLKIYQSLS